MDSHLQIHASEHTITVFWIEGGSIVHKWTSGDELPPAMRTVMADLHLVYDAVEEVAGE